MLNSSHLMEETHCACMLREQREAKEGLGVRCNCELISPYCAEKTQASFNIMEE